MQLDEFVQNLDIEIVTFAEVLADGRFIQSFAFVQEFRHVLRRIVQQPMLYQILDSLKAKFRQKAFEKLSRTYFFRIHVEFLSTNRHLFRFRIIFPKIIRM